MAGRVCWVKLFGISKPTGHGIKPLGGGGMAPATKDGGFNITGITTSNDEDIAGAYRDYDGLVINTTDDSGIRFGVRCSEVNDEKCFISLLV